MATVTVEINGRPHQVGCAEGQQARVQQLAASFDRVVRQVATDVGQVGDLRLFLMAGLLLADENAEIKASEAVAAPQTGGVAGDDGQAEAAEAIEAAAKRVEALLGRL